MSKDNKELEKSIKTIPALEKGINALIATLTFSAKAEDKIMDGTNLILPEKIEVAEKVFIKEDEEEIAAPDGRYKFEDNKDIITVKNGVIKNITKETTTEEEFVDVRTKDGKILRYEGDTPKIGLDIFVVDDTGQEKAPDGDHELENGMIITVQDGKITNVSKPEAANEEEDMAKVQELIGQLKALGVTVETMKTENKELKKDNEEIKKEHATLSVIMRQTFKIVELISKQPSEESKGSKETFGNENEPVDITAALADYRADLKDWRTGKN